MWATALPILGGWITDIIQHRREKSQAKHEREVKVINGEISLDSVSAGDMRFSWKDEYLTIIISLPFLTIFYGTVTDNPELAMRTAEALEAMANAPEWYQWSFIGIVAGSFGLRAYKGLKKP